MDKNNWLYRNDGKLLGILAIAFSVVLTIAGIIQFYREKR